MKHENATLEQDESLRELVFNRIKELRKSGHYDLAKELEHDLSETERGSEDPPKS
ncbi:MAG: hypothetical protein JXB19_01790 [Bacteroidales bacterium]|nr:hypothetical protein [Bacteroidales bacterium]